MPKNAAISRNSRFQFDFHHGYTRDVFHFRFDFRFNFRFNFDLIFDLIFTKPPIPGRPAESWRHDRLRRDPCLRFRLRRRRGARHAGPR